MKNIFKKVTPLALAVLMLSGCEKEYLDTTPTDAVDANTVFASTDGAYVALNGVYRWMYAFRANHGDFGQKGHDMAMDLMGNDMVVHTQGYGWFIREYNYAEYKRNANGSRPDNAWDYYYTMINNANYIIKNIDSAAGSVEDKENIKGQAYAIRANSYFYLVNLYQHTYKGNESAPGVPIYTEPTSVGAPRGTVEQVYTQIISDLTEAEALLEGKPNKMPSHIDVDVVEGIRARVALQMEDYETAATKAHEAREGYELMSPKDYLTGFNSTDNDEWMWGLDVINDQATIYASFYSHMDPYAGGYATLGTQKKITKALYDQIAADDVRKQVFTTPGTGTTYVPDYASVKFWLPDATGWQGDYVLMRAAEMYLIEAEALARTGQVGEAAEILEELVNTRYITETYTAPTDATALLNEILLQRRIELWGEGFALLDIKRLKTGLQRPTGPGNHNTLAGVTDLPAGDNKFLWAIPQKEIDSNPAIEPADQNP